MSNAMRPRDAARTLGISIDAVYRLLWSGKLSGHRVEGDSGDWQVNAEDVQARLRMKRNGSRAKAATVKETKRGHGTHRAAH